jgi:dsDNA-specific endonuclease/ATPase MutS2
MNLSGVIKWSRRIQKAYPSLTKQEQETFAFTRTYSKVVKELDCLFEFVNESLKLIKTKGLSTKNINLCLGNMNRQLRNKGARIDRVCQSISRYLQEAQSKLTDEKTVWHASSDIIESIFGSYKFKKSKNQLNGITFYVLVLPY